MQNKPQTEPFRTVLTITAGFLVIYLIWGWQWALITALVSGIAGVLSTRLAGFIHWLWMKIAWLLSFIIPTLILTLIFYIILLPLALLSRIFRKEKPVVLENTRDSMFRDNIKIFGKDDFKNPW